MSHLKRCYFLFPVIVLLLVFLFSHGMFSLSFPQEIQKSSAGLEKEEKIVPSAGNIKQKTAIYVFLSWVWLAILVLIYFIRLKIKEVDRLYRLGYFQEKKTRE